MGVRGKDTVDVDAEKDARGEYGLVLTFGSAAGASGKVYDFGVD